MLGGSSFCGNRNDGGEEGVACWQSPFALVTELRDAKYREETRRFRIDHQVGMESADLDRVCRLQNDVCTARSARF